MVGVALATFVDVAARLDKRPLRVDAQQCVRSRHKNTTCNRCVAYCPYRAVKWDESLQVDWDKCQDCGICTSVCPTDALVAVNPSNAELLKRIEARRGTESLTFVCAES